MNTFDDVSNLFDHDTEQALLDSHEKMLISQVLSSFSPPAAKMMARKPSLETEKSCATDFLLKKAFIARHTSITTRNKEASVHPPSTLEGLELDLGDDLLFDLEDCKPPAVTKQGKAERPALQSSNPPCLQKMLEDRAVVSRATDTSISFHPQTMPSIPRGIDTERALHRACQLFPNNKRMVEASLRLDPNAIRRKAFIDSIPSQTRKHQEAIHKMFPRRRPKAPEAAPEPFQLPINIALYHDANLEVLDFLVQADPSQLLMKDGIHGINSLCLALDRRPNDIACLGLLLINNPEGVKIVDIFENTPLHIACQKGASLQVAQMLVKLHPSALTQRNGNGLLPIDIIQKLPGPATNEVLNFLTEKTRQLQNTPDPESAYIDATFSNFS